MSLSISEALSESKQLAGYSDSSRLDAELFLAAALNCSREYIYTWPNDEVSRRQLNTYHSYLERRRGGEPVAYILGRQAFWDFDLTVNESVLIPRPETEQLVEWAIDLLSCCSSDCVHIADLGTGSGAIALALASTNHFWQLSAVDVSEDALKVARMNAEELNLTNIDYIHASWCDGFTQDKFDLIVANPPYVAKGDPHLREGDLPFEPELALISDESGKADIRRIAQSSREFLKDDSWLLLEHGYDQKQEVEIILKSLGYKDIECRQDYAGIDRMTIGKWFA
ncbi:MAG: peptide chain release factor N(5)-glutamine methyltransferase [Gammaproteobacteria bacterium]|jgi:release factor glutamine methyltransferase|nr:peptide chain release factor N(5)-glutamine methyltransferase [Gammaproteobacteria bacterium]